MTSLTPNPKPHIESKTGLPIKKKDPTIKKEIGTKLKALVRKNKELETQFSSNVS